MVGAELYCLYHYLLLKVAVAVLVDTVVVEVKVDTMAKVVEDMADTVVKAMEVLVDITVHFNVMDVAVSMIPVDAVKVMEGLLPTLHPL